MKALILIVVVIGLALTGLTIAIGTNTFEGIVTKNPYEKGLKWDETINKKNLPDYSISLNNDRLVVGKNVLQAKILDKNAKPVDKLHIELTVSRPSSSKYDKVYTMYGNKEGIFQSDVMIPLQGLWDISIVASGDNGKALLQKRLYADAI